MPGVRQRSGVISAARMPTSTAARAAAAASGSRGKNTQIAAK